MKLNRRGEIVFALALTILGIQLLALGAWVIDHINYIEGVGYCFKSSLDCYFPKVGG
jgi:hypothetical protein